MIRPARPIVRQPTPFEAPRNPPSERKPAATLSTPEKRKSPHLEKVKAWLPTLRKQAATEPNNVITAVAEFEELPDKVPPELNSGLPHSGLEDGANMVKQADNLNSEEGATQVVGQFPKEKVPVVDHTTLTADEKRGRSRFAMTHEKALEIIEPALNLTEKLLESELLRKGQAVSWFKNEWALRRFEHRGTSESSESYRISTKGFSPEDQQAVGKMVDDSTKLFPSFVTDGTKFELIQKQPNEGFPGFLGQVWEFKNQIRLTIYPGARGLSLKTPQKILIHELTHRGMKFLATHNPTGFRELMRQFVDLFKQESRLVYENINSREHLGRLQSLGIRFGVHPAIDEAANDAIASTLYKKINGVLSPEFGALYQVPYEDNEGRISKLADDFMRELSLVPPGVSQKTRERLKPASFEPTAVKG